MIAKLVYIKSDVIFVDTMSTKDKLCSIQNVTKVCLMVPNASDKQFELTKVGF